MFVERIAPHRAWTEMVIVRLFRRWVAAREQGEGLAGLIELAAELGFQAPAAIALDSLLQLTESCLGRRLRAECCCNQLRGPDEQAVLLLIAAAQEAWPGFAPAAMPHGLPSALVWAAVSLNHLLDDPPPLPVRAPQRCPFGPAR
jgi:hypothetical protein